VYAVSATQKRSTPAQTATMTWRRGSRHSATASAAVAATVATAISVPGCRSSIPSQPPTWFERPVRTALNVTDGDAQ
jgi:hypothetical protein